LKFFKPFAFLAFISVIAISVPTSAQMPQASVCSEEAQAVQEGLASLKISAVSQQEDAQEIRACFDSLVRSIQVAPAQAAHLRMELDVRLEAFKTNNKENGQLIKDLHGRITSLMKCHGIKPPSNGVAKAH